jgi:hypothetical protein
LTAEQIEHSRGREAFSYALTDKQLADIRASRGPMRGSLPYRYLVRSPGSASMAWTAFYTKRDLLKFTRSYGLKIVGSTTPGSRFVIKIPGEPKMHKLVCRPTKRR